MSSFQINNPNKIIERESIHQHPTFRFINMDLQCRENASESHPLGDETWRTRISLIPATPPMCSSNPQHLIITGRGLTGKRKSE
ncbi:hypothetical protein TNCT_689141 [Trichonephila clavata]|uniref:Uncharacterized protein n=1 Tax=Trichonephila clavata TaxID=2740835 RepID=A0A8X6L427_TRICU|nr:hypothetical protein TNCT_689141 [Trichonephila clavata]